MLVAAASVLVVYKHFTDDQGGDPIKHFLALIVIQMLPLVFLQKKILSCPVPVIMLSQFGAKVLLMHGFFLTLRVLAWPLLEIGLGFCITTICKHVDFGLLLLLAVSGSFLTELLDFK